MKIYTKKNVGYIPRVSHWLKDRKGFYTMERNERVDEFKDEYIKKIFKNIFSFDLRTYPENNYVYDKLAKWLKIKKENLLITEGADGGLLRIFNVFADNKDKIVALEPSYAMYPLYCKMFKSKYVPLKISQEVVSDYFNTLIKFIRKNKPKILAIANPNQPVEVMLKKKELEKLCKISRKLNILLVIDEAYYHFNNITGIDLIKKYENLIIVRTFSKAFGLAGLRIGYCISNKKIIDLLKSIKPIYEINSVSSKILISFLSNIQIMKRYVYEVNKSKIYLKNFLKKYNIEMLGKYSNTVALPFSNSQFANKVVNELYQRKFVVRLMKDSFGNTFIRCTIGSLKITKKFTKELKKIFKRILK